MKPKLVPRPGERFGAPGAQRKGQSMNNVYECGISNAVASPLSAKFRKILIENTKAVDNLPTKGPVYLRNYPLEVGASKE